MATITPTQIVAKDATVKTLGPIQFGETIAIGDPVYLKTSDNKYWLTDANVQATALAAGLAMHAYAADEWGWIVTSGPVDIGPALTVGDTLIVSATAGEIDDGAGYASGWYRTRLGDVSATDTLNVDIQATGNVKA